MCLKHSAVKIGCICLLDHFFNAIVNVRINYVDNLCIGHLV